MIVAKFSSDHSVQHRIDLWVRDEPQMRLDCDLKRDIEGNVRSDAAQTIKHELPFSWESVTVIVENDENDLITLKGEVEWRYQRERAEEAVQRLGVVRRVINVIEIRPRVASV
jgi:BON domain